MPAGGCNTLNEVQHILINPPLIFTMQLIWESNAENAGEIRATMDAIQEVGCLHIISWQYLLQCSCQGMPFVGFARPSDAPQTISRAASGHDDSVAWCRV